MSIVSPSFAAVAVQACLRRIAPRVKRLLIILFTFLSVSAYSEIVTLPDPALPDLYSTNLWSVIESTLTINADWGLALNMEFYEFEAALDYMQYLLEQIDIGLYNFQTGIELLKTDVENIYETSASAIDEPVYRLYQYARSLCSNDTQRAVIDGYYQQYVVADETFYYTVQDVIDNLNDPEYYFVGITYAAECVTNCLSVVSDLENSAESRLFLESASMEVVPSSTSGADLRDVIRYLQTIYTWYVEAREGLANVDSTVREFYAHLGKVAENFYNAVDSVFVTDYDRISSFTNDVERASFYGNLPILERISVSLYELAFGSVQTDPFDEAQNTVSNVLESASNEYASVSSEWRVPTDLTGTANSFLGDLKAGVTKLSNTIVTDDSQMSWFLSGVDLSIPLSESDFISASLQSAPVSYDRPLVRWVRRLSNLGWTFMFCLLVYRAAVYLILLYSRLIAIAWPLFKGDFVATSKAVHKFFDFALLRAIESLEGQSKNLSLYEFY